MKKNADGIWILVIGLLMAAPLFAISLRNAKNVANEPIYISDEYFIEETHKTAKKGIFDDYTEDCASVSVAESQHCGYCSQDRAETEPETVPEIMPETMPDPGTEETKSYPLYSVNGSALDEDLQRFLYDELSEKCLEYWMPIALCQMYQESSFDSLQVTNGIDKGILQYRCIYWDEWQDRAGVEHGDIFNPYKQIEVYCRMIKQWLDAGETEAKAISNHNSGGWDSYFAEAYYNDVAQWFDTVEQIK